MIRTILLFFVFHLFFVFVGGSASGQGVLEPYTYANDFETGRLGAWASYPLWQDNAYDANFQVERFGGDTGTCIVEKVTPYSRVDNYAGAQKLLDMYLVPGSGITVRYFLKTYNAADFLKIRLAAGPYGSLDVTLAHPATGAWSRMTVGYDDFVRENPGIRGKGSIRVYALAFLAKVSRADPDMPIYLALDDISFKGARSMPFRFDTPAIDRLPEFSEYIPARSYHRGDRFRLSGHWPLDASKVSMKIVSFTDTGKTFYRGNLRHGDDRDGWVAEPVALSFPEGLYRGELVAYRDSVVLARTSFTLHIAPVLGTGQHPRLLFDEGGLSRIKARLEEGPYQGLVTDLLRDARTEREKIPVQGLRYCLDQFPDEDWLPSWTAFGEHIYNTGTALKWNAFAYAFCGDTAAGRYTKDVLVALSGWPSWVSPWMVKRGRFADHRMGAWSHDVALAYDLTYRLMTPEEAAGVRKAIVKHIVQGAHYTYVYDNEVTSNTSNWIGHIMGGSLLCMAAIEGDGPETENLEPWFTGALLKFNAFLTHVTDTVDGSWGEGWGYNNYTFSNLAYSLPGLKNVFHIDLSAPLVGTYNEYIWGGLIRDRRWFGFGDSGDSLLSGDNWAFLLSMDKEPRLSWYYHYLKNRVTWNDVLFDTRIPQADPFGENPVKAFRKIGTTVFKSGWGKDDLAFVMRTGAFFNHQHLDQGSFWLADRGIVFIEDPSIEHSNYYDDPLYQSTFIQPVAHSTILIDGNLQSQRTGDPLDFAPGFDDRAGIGEFLDGRSAAFSSGDIGRLYWGKVDSLTRNVLFIKPRSLLMLDVAVPKSHDVDVTLLYHTHELADIHADTPLSTITKQGVSLNLVHLSPEPVVARAVETPHFLNTLLKERVLKKEGMLTETAHTAGGPLVIANLLTTTDAGVAPDVTSKKGVGCVSGMADGRKFAFTSKPGHLYGIEGIETDALALTWDDSSAFVAMATIFRKDGVTVVRSDASMTFEVREKEVRYYRSVGGMLGLYEARRPLSVKVNGVAVHAFTYDPVSRQVRLFVAAGEGTIVVLSRRL